MFRPFLAIAVLIRTATIAVTSGCITCAAYSYFLAHRSDYVGHYAAGFGGTLLALSVGVGLIPKAINLGSLARAVFWISIGAICLGGFFEATVFRLAIFDPVDFCNQSLGAMIAALSFLAIPPRLPLSGQDVGSLCIVSFIFLIGGFFWAFA